MLRRLRLGMLLAAAALAALGAAEAGSPVPDAATAGAYGRGEVAIFYYGWYGTQARDGAYVHWGQNGHTAPGSIASAFFPARGVYSSSDPAVLQAQMTEIAAAGVNTVILSWWGQGSLEDVRLDAVAAAARARGLRVALHVEPYPGRTPARAVADMKRLRGRGITDFYVYDSTLASAEEWAVALGALQGVRVFANTALVGLAKKGGFDGLYTYDVYVYDGSSFPRVCASARRHKLLCAPSVGPGYDARRATGLSRLRPRRRGDYYDWMWRQAVEARADVVTITSYNEWHEGTQIEPARSIGGPYASYEGAWGLRGRAAERAYLNRTAFWSRLYSLRLANS